MSCKAICSSQTCRLFEVRPASKVTKMMLRGNYENEQSTSLKPYLFGVVPSPPNPLLKTRRSFAKSRFFSPPIGGGLGGTRRGGADVNVRHSGREDGGGRRSRSRERGTDGGGFGAGSRRRSRCDTRILTSKVDVIFKLTVADNPMK